MKISRVITSCLSCSRTASLTAWPLAVTCLASASTRAIGTPLPLTMATFWADAQGAATSRAAAVSAVKENFMLFLGKERSRWSDGWAVRFPETR